MNKLYTLIVASVLLASCAGLRNNSLHPAFKIYGEFHAVEERNYIVPYSLNLMALQQLNEGKNENVREYITWYLDRLNYPDKNGLVGTIYDFRIYRNNTEASTNSYDSVDGYAGTFLYLLNRYYQKTGDKQLIEKNKTKIEDIARTILLLQDKDGLTSAVPGKSKVKYLMDNCEAYGGLRAFAALSQKMNWDSIDLERPERALRIGIWKFFDRRTNTFCWALEGEKNYEAAWNTFYPDAFAQLFPILFGLLEEDAPLRDSLWKNFIRFHAEGIKKSSADQKIVFELAGKMMRESRKTDSLRKEN